MSERDHRDALTLENATNKTYMAEVARKPVHRVAASPQARDTRPRPGLPRPEAPGVFPLVGRVGLLGAPADLGGLADFYIGSRHHVGASWEVFSWAAPIAATFFGVGGHELCGQVAVRRTFRAEADQIVEFTDEAIRELAGASPFTARTALQVPAPPRAAARPAAAPAPNPVPPVPSATPQPPPAPPNRLAVGMRAADAVLAALDAPRRTQLRSVLATLQPDQYDAVTRPATVPLVVQGHPGTGKTIIAAHRAAYLVHPDRGRDALGRILLVGPTLGYARHVQELLADLDPEGRVTLVGLEAALMEIAGIKETPRGPAVGDLADVDWEVQQFFERAAQVAARTGFAPRPGVSRAEALWQGARTNRLGAEPVTKNTERATWGRSLPEFGAARLRRRYLPALAQCALAASTSTVQRYDHIVVDEAQDVRPLEWAILRRLNPAEGWTIVGDVNQRRTEHSHSSWGTLLHDLAIDDVKPLVLERGYRSTRPIMQFANRLLPKDQRSLTSLRETGPQPRTVAAKLQELNTAIVAQAAALTGRYPHGTTAIIMVELARMIGALRERGWQGSSTHEWTNGAARIFLLTPDEARGVEFDGVVVVEPADFPDTFGRRGPLYTSLTRANQELVVVHSKPLPEPLRR